MVWLSVSPPRQKPRDQFPPARSTIRFLTLTQEKILSSCNLRCVLIFPYGRAHARCGYLSHLLDEIPRYQFPPASSTKRFDIYPRKDIVSSCNLRCLSIFPYGRAHAWCGYLSHLLDEIPRYQFPPASSTKRFLTYTQEKILYLAAICLPINFSVWPFPNLSVAIACVRADFVYV